MYKRRQTLLISILMLSILAVGLWMPGTQALLHPPEPTPVPEVTVCTNVTIKFNDQNAPTVSPADVDQARKWVGEPDTTMASGAAVWDTQNKRVEFWLSDGITMWQIEFVCFEYSTYDYVFGAYEAFPMEDVIAREEAEQLKERPEVLTR